MRRHLALAEPHAEIHRQRVAGKRDEKRGKDIDLAEAFVHPQQENAAIHHREHDAADDSDRNVMECNRIFGSVVLHRSEKQEHYDQPAERHRAGKAQSFDAKCADFLVHKLIIILQKDCKHNTSIGTLRYALPRGIHQLIRCDAGNAAHKQHRRPRGTGKQHREQQRQTNGNNQPSLFHCISSL